MLKSQLKILVFGSTGLVGSRFVELYKTKFEIITVGRNNCNINLDILDINNLSEFCKKYSYDVIINFAAYTNVDEAENEKNNKTGEVYKLNVLLPYYLAQASYKKNKYLYHISTDYVFDGKSINTPYSETDLPKPIDSWYCKTKYEGEQQIAKAFNGKNLYSIIRISYPFSGFHSRKLDIARVIIYRLRQGEVYFGIVDQKIKPTLTDNIAHALDLLIQTKAYGIYHVTGSYKNDFITPYEFALKVAEIFNLDSSLIKQISFLDFSKIRIAKRPQNTWLKTDKIEKLGLKLLPIEKSIEDFKNQLISLH